MSLSERRRQFEAASKADPLVTRSTKFHKLFGVSNSAKVIPGGLQLGVVNLDNVADDVDAFAFACTMVFPPFDEVYFTAYVSSGKGLMVQRLNEMKSLAAGGSASSGVVAPIRTEATDSSERDEDSSNGSRLAYASRNNNTVVVLASDGNLYLRNQSFWDELPENMQPFVPAIPVDKITVAIYPPAASARRSLLARGFIGYLGDLIGRQRVHETRVWTDIAAINPAMQRMPTTIPVIDIEAAVTELGGHYPGGEVRKYHAALNFLQHKHFVILAGLSGTGKTQLAVQYARAVHGIATIDAPDPFLFVCPVRPEWTDPTGLTGYYDVLSNRYIVPPFLEAVLVAMAHKDSPVFVILDEMNLARVEYYFSDVLSAIETNEPLQLHSSGVPLEGSNGVSILAELSVPPNLFITGTINIDETTNPVSDKVLDRAFVIDMSAVDISGFLAALAAREPLLSSARIEIEPYLLSVHKIMVEHGLGFGYRVAEEVVRYHAFVTSHLVAVAEDTNAYRVAEAAATNYNVAVPNAATETNIIDDLMVQKVLVKLRGAERQRHLLTSLARALQGLPHSQTFISRLIKDLDEFGSFQASR